MADADFTAIYGGGSLPTQDEARDFYRSLGAFASGGWTSGVVAGGGDDLFGQTDPFVATPAGSAVLPLGPGRAWGGGIFSEFDSGNAGTHADADGSNDRWDSVVVEHDLVAKTSKTLILEGTPAASPVVEGLTRSSTKWHEPLYDVLIPSGGGAPTIDAPDVWDRRHGPGLIHVATDDDCVGLWSAGHDGGNRAWNSTTGGPIDVDDGDAVLVWRYLTPTLMHVRFAMMYGAGSTPGTGALEARLPDGAITPTRTGDFQKIEGWFENAGFWPMFGILADADSVTGWVYDDQVADYQLAVPSGFGNGDSVGWAATLDIAALTDNLRPAAAV